MKIYLKYILFVITILVLVLLTISTKSNAIADVFSDGSYFLTQGSSPSTIINETSLQNASNFIYNIFLGIAIALAGIVGVVLGIQFITGSIAEQAKIKEALVAYVISCIVIFGAFTIWKLVVNVGTDIENKISESAEIHKEDKVSESAGIHKEDKTSESAGTTM